ncbi:MAG TPA: ion transporter [Polyangiaceae bacterium]|nr:ion transporter [Polyangiaceae bacterium]
MSLRRRLYIVIFEHDTRAGRAFDVALLWAILLSVLSVVLESVESVRSEYGAILRAVEWGFTGLFTIEYLLRLYCAPQRLRYPFSFFGLVDLVALLPSFVSVAMPGAQSLLVIRVFRLLRVFRILKLVHLHGQADTLLRAVRASIPKIVVFMGAVFTIVIIVGSAMYLVEGPSHGFDNIPQGMYWAIVTMTTVGFGDITPETPLGRVLAAVLMLMGYGILAVPTGIVSAEMVRARDSTSQASTSQASTTRGAAFGLAALDHVNLRTARLALLTDFYLDVLDLRRGPRPNFPFAGAWLYLGDRPLVHLVEVQESREPAEGQQLEHFALSATGQGAFLERLTRRGIPFRIASIEVPTPSGLRPVTQIKLSDPDGNKFHVDFAG